MYCSHEVQDERGPGNGGGTMCFEGVCAQGWCNRDTNLLDICLRTCSLVWRELALRGSSLSMNQSQSSFSKYVSERDSDKLVQPTTVGGSAAPPTRTTPTRVCQVRKIHYHRQSDLIVQRYYGARTPRSHSRPTLLLRSILDITALVRHRSKLRLISHSHSPHSTHPRQCAPA